MSEDRFATRCTKIVKQTYKVCLVMFYPAIYEQTASQCFFYLHLKSQYKPDFKLSLFLWVQYSSDVTHHCTELPITGVIQHWLSIIKDIWHITSMKPPRKSELSAAPALAVPLHMAAQVMAQWAPSDNTS